MKREELIKKWLDDALSPQEFEAFKQLEDYKDLIRLSNATKHFKSKDFNTDTELERLKQTQINNSKNNWLKPFLRVAAILAICFATYYYTTTLGTNVKTLVAQKDTIELPDHSSVTLNATSSLHFNEKKWSSKREIKLNGEAYFKVSKGSKFSVETPSGTVSVLGTQFNVKDRNDLFEVVCYEGSVRVDYNSESVILKPGNSFLIINETKMETETISEEVPSWINNESTFKSIPYNQVIAEFERQYNVVFNVKNIETKQLFTGSFGHNNIDVAIKAITLPLNLTYSKNNNTISLKRE